MGAGVARAGGVYVLANIRGGGEFGPAVAPRRAPRGPPQDPRRLHRRRRGPHQARRHLAAPPRHHGRQPGRARWWARPSRSAPSSSAPWCATVPLLDMKRYHKLLAGASWMGEYGDPDVPGDWEFISKYSPYQNVAKAAKYPRVFFTTSTRDDRVHPGHARKMVREDEGAGARRVVFREHRGRPRRGQPSRAAGLHLGARSIRCCAMR